MLRALHSKALLRVGLFCATIVLTSAPCSMAGEEAKTPTEAVKETVDAVIAILSDPEMNKPGREQERRQRLEEVIGRRFDYAEMGKRTLAKHWRKLTPAQQQEFVQLFQQFLTNSYAGNVDGYSGEQVQYLKERLKGNFAEVQTKVVSPKVQIPLDYRLINKNGEWKVYDVVIDGVSLMQNYRRQFDRIIRTSSFDGLLEQLKSKAAQSSTKSS
ncbi:MAG: ABC transporter substrate-binding protein [Nitrospirae bacterium]|nr:MAG: ABC transporter substrate-binding protein [Nitrospirota bacterium]